MVLGPLGQAGFLFNIYGQTVHALSSPCLRVMDSPIGDGAWQALSAFHRGRELYHHLLEPRDARAFPIFLAEMREQSKALWSDLGKYIFLARRSPLTGMSALAAICEKVRRALSSKPPVLLREIEFVRTHARTPMV